MNVPFLDLQAQYRTLKSEMDAAIQAVIDASAFVSGPFVERFESAFAAYCGTRYCVAVNSGTSALQLLLAGYGIGPGDEVITAANTFFATVEAIVHAGARPVLVDCLPDTALIDPALVARAITPRTKAIIPVHLYGQPADMEEILTLAWTQDISVIEDACQAHGALYQGKRTGSLADGAAFSFYPGKNLGAYGEGGAVTTDDPLVAERVRLLREHGQPQRYAHHLMGWNERMDGIQGAVLSVKLPHLEEWNARRRQIVQRYHERLADTPGVSFFTQLPDRTSACHLCTVKVEQRDQMQRHLSERGIQTGIHYPVPIHLQPGAAFLGYGQGDFPVAEHLATQILSLPLYPELSDAQVDQVAEALGSITRSPALAFAGQ